MVRGFFMIIFAMQKLPKISVNIPIKPNSTLKPVLDSLRKVDYPSNLVEIIIVEGNQIAKQRNKAIKHSSGELIYLLDNDSEIKPNSFKIIAREFGKKNIGAVGGPSLTKKDGNYLNFLIGRALETYFGAMRMRFRYSEQNQYIAGNEYHLIGANLALRKKSVEKIGFFNEKIFPNEETELLRRLKKTGYNLIYNKNLSINRSHRKNLKDLAKQFFNYGVGRTKQIMHNGSLEDFIFVLPVGFFLYLISLFFYNPKWYLYPLFLYLLLALLTSWKASLKYRKADLIFSLPTIFLVIHISYAFGIIYESINFLFSNQKELNLKKIKVRIIKLADLSNNSNLP